MNTSVPAGIFTLPTPFSSATFDFMSLSADGIKIAGATFETGAPLPAVPAPAAFVLVVAALGVGGALGLRSRRRG